MFAEHTFCDKCCSQHWGMNANKIGVGICEVIVYTEDHDRQDTRLCKGFELKVAIILQMLISYQVFVCLFLMSTELITILLFYLVKFSLTKLYSYQVEWTGAVYLHIAWKLYLYLEH